MIFDVEFWVVSLFASLVKFILGLFIGAVLVFYAKFSKDEYASSIRWSRTGGVFEMIHLFYRSLWIVPGKSSIVLALATIASVFVMFVSSVLTAMVSPAYKGSSPTTARVFGKHLLSMDASFWNMYMSADSSMKETLIAMLNDTRRNPNPSMRTRYTPRTYAYETGCNESTAIITHSRASFHFPPSETMCKGYSMVTLKDVYWEPESVSIRAIDSSTFMWVAPVVSLVPSGDTKAITPVFLAHESEVCLQRFFNDDMDALSDDFPEDGIISLPKTIVSKCRYDSNASLVLSMTFLQFAVGHMQDFNKIAVSILDDPASLPLLKHMDSVISNGIFSNTTNNSTLVILTKVASTASDVDFLLCMSVYSQRHGNMGLLCTYALTSMINIKPQAMDPTIAKDLSQNALPLQGWPGVQLDFTIFHLPRVPESEIALNTTPLFSSAHLIKAQSDAALYLASLGHNVVVFKDENSILGHLYILYDAVELKDAYEISTIAFYVVCVFTGLCGIAWILSEWPKFFPTVYNSSLYKVIYTEIKSKDESAPMLMRCTHDPLAFDGNKVVPQLDDEPNGVPETTSKDTLPMMPLLPGNDTPEQQENQPPMLQKIPALSQLLDIRRTIASTSTTTPGTSIANAWESHSTQLQPLGTNPGAPPPVPVRPYGVARRNPFTPSVQTPRLSATTDGTTIHDEGHSSATSACQGPTMIQSPFE